VLGNFEIVKDALEYIDKHIDEPMTYETLAERFHYSPYYFHRMFSAIVGKAITAHVRDRRFIRACIQLVDTDESILNIGMDCGYTSAQSFSRAFRNIYGLSPSEYRKQEITPIVSTVNEMVIKFTNRLKGGIVVNPKIIRRDEIMIACTSGDGNKTLEVWQSFEKLSNDKPLINKVSDNGYEVRVYNGDKCTVYTGLSVTDTRVDPEYTIFKIPASKYASLDVYPASGYDSENKEMDGWLATNSEGFSDTLLNNQHYCVEFYDERFKGDEAGSIVEIWVPIEKA
jgi:AraC-like DNA-binding protein/predicted transcriptional regulator YdeE